MMNSIQILYENENYLIVNKPPDLVINSDDANNKNTLHCLLSYKLKDYTLNSSLKHGFHFVHRLDYATSGVICLAKNKIASAIAGKLFQSRIVEKYYLAIVRGHIVSEFIAIDKAIGYDKAFLSTSKKMCVDGDNCLKPRSAITLILVLERGFYDGELATKVLLKPLTGRRHQLRLHCNALGHNIVGDYTYSNKEDADTPRMFLHSYRLVLPIPQDYIDVCTMDPFVASSERLSGWCSDGVVNTLNKDEKYNAFVKLNNYDSNNV